MGFYTDPSFFILLAAAIVPAAVLGCLERPTKTYGLVVSWLFLLGLFWGDPASLGLVAGYIALTYLSTGLVLRRRRKLVSAGHAARLGWPVRLAGLACAIGPLVAYKVSTAVTGAGVLGFLGISYVTFKATQVLIEVEDGLITSLPFLDYAYFLSFFAVFTSGPIDRSRRFFEDVGRVRPRREYLDLLGRGVVMLFVGAAFQIVLASVFKQWYQPKALDPSSPVGPQVWDAVVCGYAYAAYLYFDFAGYSLMAQGASFCLGIETPTNFRMPFVSCTLEEFWDRWHITLSHWLRDYVFMRLERALARRRWPKGRDARAELGLVCNMCLMGAWHGLAPQYLLYGAYHGILLAIGEVLKKRWKFYRLHKGDLGMRAVSWFVTMNVVVFGFAIFSGQAFTFFGGLLG